MRIAVTGASGSLGGALLDRLTAVGGADQIVGFSRDEQKRARLEARYRWHPGVRVYAGDIRDADRLADIFHGCEVVVHAAARKVVTAHPDEAEEMLKTNVVGSLNVIGACRRAGVRKLVVVSSDKAVRAENVYGVSKAMMEHLAVMANARTFPQGMRVGVVRYGNVVGSTGSVVQVWRGQAERGEPLTVANPDITRFWISLPRAVDLVLGALGNLRGGEIVVPDLPAASIGALAAALFPGAPWRAMEGAPMEGGGAARQGGEKLHEELLSAAEVRRALRRNGCFVIPPWQHEFMWDARPWIGDPVPPDLVYRSDVWRRATEEELRELAGAPALARTA